MNDYPQRNGLNGSPAAGVPALVANGPREIWQPPAQGYPSDESAYGLIDAGNFVQDLRRYFWILFRHRWVVLGVTVVFLCIGALVTFLSTPIYRASTTIQIDREPAKIVNVEDIQANLGSDAGFYATQYEILKSRSLAERVASDLSVEDLRQFTQKNTTSPWRKLVQALVALVHPASGDGNEVASLQRAVAGQFWRIFPSSRSEHRGWCGSAMSILTRPGRSGSPTRWQIRSSR